MISSPHLFGMCWTAVDVGFWWQNSWEVMPVFHNQYQWCEIWGSEVVCFWVVMPHTDVIGYSNLNISDAFYKPHFQSSSWVNMGVALMAWQCVEEWFHSSYCHLKVFCYRYSLQLEMSFLPGLIIPHIFQ
jgi:hypothetical protein